MDFTLLFFVAILAGIQIGVSSYSYDKDSKKHLIYWDSTITKCINDPDYSIEVQMGEFLDVVCPHINLGKTNGLVAPDSFDIINVTKHGHETCNGKGGRLMFSCDRPEQENKLTIKFQSISPSPFGFRFHECSEYYFLAVKRTTGKHKPFRNHGCTEESQRLHIKVGCPNDKEQKVEPPTQKPKTSFVDRIIDEKKKKENQTPVVPEIVPVTKDPKDKKKNAAVSASQSLEDGENSSTKTAHLNSYFTSLFALISMFYIINTST